MTVLRAARRRAGLLLPPILLAGCASTWIEGDRLREEPLHWIQQRVEDARGTPFLHDVATRVVSSAEVPDVVRRVVAERRSPEEIAVDREALVSVGLWPADRDLLDAYAAVSGDELAGLYVPHERTLYVVRDPRLPMSAWFLGRDAMLQFALGHELMHALQHQVWPDLFALEAFLQTQSDAGGALQAAIEGDATLFGMLAAGRNPPPPAEVRESMETSLEKGRSRALADAPALIRLSLLFPYVSGYALSYREGSALLDDPPASTEQVLHPEARRASFEAMDLAPARSLLPADCRVIDENTIGELALSILLRDLTPPGEAMSTAWEGWDGDRVLVARCGERREFVWIVRWDSARDAGEFETAYRGIAASVRERGALSGDPVVSIDDRTTVVATPGLIAVAPEIARLARRARVTALHELRAHFGEFRREPSGVETRAGER